MKNKSSRNTERAALTNAIHRCHNEKHAAYFNYGARGLTVYEEWHGPTGFGKFLEHIGPKPHPTLTLDRIDNDLGYHPGNVRWATRSEQQRNRRPSKNLAAIRNAPRNEAIRAMRESGADALEIGEAFCLSTAQVYRICKSNPLPN